jgi:hypothetical protein
MIARTPSEQPVTFLQDMAEDSLRPTTPPAQTRKDPSFIPLRAISIATTPEREAAEQQAVAERDRHHSYRGIATIA